MTIDDLQVGTRSARSRYVDVSLTYHGSCYAIYEW
jgi:hypothetical protein